MGTNNVFSCRTRKKIIWTFLHKLAQLLDHTNFQDYFFGIPWGENGSFKLQHFWANSQQTTIFFFLLLFPGNWGWHCLQTSPYKTTGTECQTLFSSEKKTTISKWHLKFLPTMLVWLFFLISISVTMYTAPEKALIPTEKYWYFFYFSTKTCVVGFIRSISPRRF